MSNNQLTCKQRSPRTVAVNWRVAPAWLFLCAILFLFSGTLRAGTAVEKPVDNPQALEITPQSYYDLGLANYSSHPAQAELYYQKAITLASAQKDQLLVVKAKCDLGSLYHYKLQRSFDGLKLVEDSITLSRQIGNASEEGWGLLRLGEIYYEEKDFSRAYECFDQALKIFQKLKNGNREGYAYRNIGKVHMIYGDYDAAIACFEKALRNVQNPSIKKAILLGLGDAQRYKHQYGAALERYQEALEIIRNGPDKAYLDLVLGNIGVIYAEQGKTSQALAYLEQALQAAKARKAKRHAAQWQTRIADVMFRQGDYRKAEQLYTLSEDVKRVCPEVASEAYEGLAAVTQHAGEDRKALAYYERAINVVDDLKRNLMEREWDVFFEPKISLYEKAIDLLVRMSRRDQDPSYLRRAFYHAQKIKSQSLLEFFLQGPLIHEQLRRFLDERSYKGFLNIQETLSRRYKDLMDILNGDQDVDAKEAIAKLEIDIDRLRKERLQLIRQKVPSYDKLSKPEILSVEQIQHLLKPRETLLVYFVGEAKTFVFVVRKDKFSCAQLAGQNRAGLRRRLCAISPVLCDAPPDASPRRMDERWANIQLQDLHQLYSDIFKPLEAQLGASEELIIIPDDALYRLPFEMLVTKLWGLEAPSYLLERYATAYAYSTSFLNPDVYRSHHRPAPGAEQSVFIGNPDFRNYRMSQNGWSNQYADLSLITRGDSFLRLPFAEREVRSGSRYDRNSVVYTGSVATESAFKASAERAKVIHVSTHYVLDPMNPLHSKMVFALNPQINQRGEDGFLYPCEILGLQLDAQLVALTGCQTGGGKLRPGEGIDGLARTFLYAGARSLLVSLWPVTDSEATVELTTRFYQYLADGLSTRKALQRAKLDLIGREYGSFYWAPFVLIGDAGTVAMKRPLLPGPTWLVYAAVGLVLLLICYPLIRRIL
jgi:CHAT domain-containing protein/lipopolysaccharide biosynthesis regulator YciM